LLVGLLVSIPAWASDLAAPSCTEDAGPEALSMLQKRAHGIVQQQSPPMMSNSVAENSTLSQGMALLEEAQLSLADACAESPGGNSHWYMKVKRVINNNLGGYGPDKSGKKEMRLRVVLGSGKGQKQTLDLIIANTTAYYPKDPSKNGLISGVKDFFNINTRGKSNTKFKARFVDSDTGKPVKLDRFFITWYDIDKTRTSLHEKLLVKDFARYTLTESTKLVSSTAGAGGGWRQFNAGKNFKGTGVDFNPDALTKRQYDVSVLLQYAKFRSFEFKLKTTGSKTVGRNYMFSGTTKLFRECNSFDCDLWGDPHISGFDQKGLALQELDTQPFEIRSFDHGVSHILPAFQGISALEESSSMQSDSDTTPHHGDLREGDMWLVKSEDVYIQGRFGLANGGKNSFLKAVAIGGPFLKGNSLVLGTNQGVSFWNNKPILRRMNTTFTSEEHFNGMSVTAHFHSEAQHISIPHRTTTGVEVSLPLGIELLLNRFDTWLGLRIHMSKRAGGQDGECGNFNGNPHDDTLVTLQNRMRVRVEKLESVFHMPFSTWSKRHESLLQQREPDAEASQEEAETQEEEEDELEDEEEEETSEEDDADTEDEEDEEEQEEEEEDVEKEEQDA